MLEMEVILTLMTFQQQHNMLGTLARKNYTWEAVAPQKKLHLTTELSLAAEKKQLMPAMSLAKGVILNISNFLS